MSGHDYTESQLVEQPAIQLLAELGWQTAVATEETFGPGSTLGRSLKSDVVLTARLRTSLEILNPCVPSSSFEPAMDALIRDRSSMSLEAANREVYALLKDGILVSVPDPEGGQKQERLRVIDWDNPTANDLLCVSQLQIQGPSYKCIPDLTLFVNGLPLVILEFKKPGVPARQGFDGNLTSYKHPQNGIPALFAYNALMIVSNGTESLVGSVTADWERFFEWKRIERENEPRRVALEVMLRGTCEPSRLLDIVENFTLFAEVGSGTAKIVGQNHQYLGVNSAIAACQEARKLGHGQGGVFWQTQGSGKSFSMVFYAQKILRKAPGNWTFVVITDRTELDDQIAKTFKSVGAITDAEGDQCHAKSGNHLRELLKGNHRYVFTLIHKFQTNEVLCDRSDVMVLVDEAHRSQYDQLALNMRSALPKATFVAFTGTPLIAGEARTKEIFGDYVSIYDFQQSVEDRATVPLFYENRTPELQLVNPTLNDEIYDLVEQADLDEDGQKKLDRELSKQVHLLTRDDRLDTVAEDIVRHYLGRGFMGKAMVVSIDKATAVRMYDKVRKFWGLETDRVMKELCRYGLPVDEKEALGARLKVLETTDMAVIVSAAQNEIEDMKALGLDIVPHRKRILNEQLDEKFKDPKDPLSLVFVCAMWLTGFDAPSCSTVYLDKPMRNHTLMQTIARANRVFPGKHCGVIVDYANVLLSLEKALALYGQGSHGERPVQDKNALADELKVALDTALAFCESHDVSIKRIEALTVGSMIRLQAIADAIDRLIAPDERRKEFQAHAQLVSILYDSVKPHPLAAEFTSRVACIRVIAAEIHRQLNPNPVDLTNIMSGISAILDKSIAGVPLIRESQPLDLSKIDFNALNAKFKESKHKTSELEALKAAIRARLARMVELNPMRVDFLEKFEELIDAYNSGSANIEALFSQLVQFTQGLSTEEQRHVREHLTEEELVLFDILMKPAPSLTVEEREAVKKATKDLLQRVKALLAPGWNSLTTRKAMVKETISDALDTGLPRAYTPPMYQEKVQTVFTHFQQKYTGGQSVYDSA